MNTAGGFSRHGAGEIVSPGMSECAGETHGGGARVSSINGIFRVAGKRGAVPEAVTVFEAVPNSVYEGMLMHDLTGRIIEVKGELWGMLDYSRDELPGMSCGNISTPDYALTVFNNIKTMAMEGSCRFHSFLAGKSGERFPAEFRSMIGKRDGCLVITSFARVNRWVRGDGAAPGEDMDGLRKLNEMQNLLFMIVSHDLLSPLSDMLASLLILEGGEDEINEDRRGLVANMKRQMERTVEMVKNLSLWAALLGKGVPLQKRTVSVKGMVEKTYDYFLDAAGKKNVSLRLEIEDGVSAYADETMLASVVRNVISNSVKYSSENGTVTARAGYSGIMIEIEVADDGVGMDEKKLKDIFVLDPGKSSPGTRGERGSGLGLFISREILARNNGMLHIASEPGKGTQCVIRIPRA